MKFWWFMMFANCLTPFLMIVLGWLLWKHYPKEINSFIGYRTRRSMKNSKTWKFGNEFCGHLWYRIGQILLIPSIVALVPFINSDKETIGWISSVLVMIQMVILLGSLIPTELALKKRFTFDKPEEG